MEITRVFLKTLYHLIIHAKILLGFCDLLNQNFIINKMYEKSLSIIVHWKDST